MSQSCQLVAIMFTDIVGYTALMGHDEEKAFTILNKNRALQKPIIEQYNGRWIKEPGDGVMASFDTVSDGVNAVIKIMEACNATKEFQLRIGIHQSEVVFENEDVFGDGLYRLHLHIALLTLYQFSFVKNCLKHLRKIVWLLALLL
ncbi:hypothetical protein BH11BAC6_BH11BAC6_05890 [soil metagenome]